jgi:hypothetical protein
MGCGDYGIVARKSADLTPTVIKVLGLFQGFPSYSASKYYVHSSGQYNIKITRLTKYRAF